MKGEGGKVSLDMVGNNDGAAAKSMTEVGGETAEDLFEYGARRSDLIIQSICILMEGVNMRSKSWLVCDWIFQDAC